MHLEMGSNQMPIKQQLLYFILTIKCIRALRNWPLWGTILWQHFSIDLGDTLGHIQIFITTWRGQQSNSITKLRRTKMLFWKSLLCVLVQSVTFPQFFYGNIYISAFTTETEDGPFIRGPLVFSCFMKNVLSMFSSWYSELPFIIFSLSFP